MEREPSRNLSRRELLFKGFNGIVGTGAFVAGGADLVYMGNEREQIEKRNHNFEPPISRAVGDFLLLVGGISLLINTFTNIKFPLDNKQE